MSSPSSAEQDHGGHHDDHHGHGHGHANDRGFAAIRRYVKQTPRMWRSEVNDAVIGDVAPTPGERVVDIGAGMGAGVFAATSSGAVIVAVEPTPFLRRVLTLRRFLHRARSRIVVVDGAAEALPAADGSIDAAWAVNAMHHWVDPRAAASELARTLRPGGRILLVDEAFGDPEHPDAARRAAKGHGPHRHGFSPVEAEAMAEALLAAGLVDVEAGRRTMAGRPALVVTARSIVGSDG
ncbi:MAG: class I SAM-dependent methyltransferase [Actinomycetota bacterium]